MYKIEKNPGSITFKLSSELRLTDSVIKESQEYLKQYEISEFSGFKLVLRELLNNAIEHGNYKIIERIVTCTIEHIEGNRFKITVEDEGEGFNYDNLIMTLPENPRQIRNRGYALINVFTDQIEFKKKGNCVTVYISFLEETTFHVSREDGWQIIKPSGDLTAATAENFRVLLIQLLDEDHTRCRFDFKHVEDIDSVSLSVLIVFAKNLIKKESKGRLEVVNMNKDLRNLFRMTRIDKLYNIVKNK